MACKILILGSEGFIGSKVVDYYLNKGNIVFGCDIYDKPTRKYYYYKFQNSSNFYSTVFAQEIFDICINASGSANVSFSLENPQIDFELNSYLTFKILDAIRLYQKSTKYLHISSAAVYGNPITIPIHESHFLNPISPYGWHKLIAENICIEYSKMYNLKINIIRPFSVFGPGLKKQIFWELYKKYLINKHEVEVWGTGDESRDFIYINDLVDAIDLILYAAIDFGVFNIASGQETSIKLAAQEFFNSIDNNTLIKYNNIVRESDPKNWRADITNLVALGFNTKVSFEEGIKKTAQWIKHQN